MKTQITKLLALVTLALSLSACGFRGNPGTSTKVGVITSIHKVGLVNQTWEAQIQRGGLSSGSGVVGAPFNFTIDDVSMVAQVEAAMKSGQEVQIAYRTEALYSAFRTESHGDFLTSIEVLKK
jgi:hypothetical protein